ncbi:metallophosphoesterase family protein [Frankia tisae]|uniref:metallophosphoesterase family protein n=1 Tax=Frankia tisae TaxID=2950104 RepID=UPI0021C22B39|nr:metallophosphoesterase family protein [Frankia tisae]
MRLILLSDTHLPTRARALPAELWTPVEEADVVLHAGDWVGRDAVDKLAARAERLIGCYGNADGRSTGRRPTSRCTPSSTTRNGRSAPTCTDAACTR